jgi:hypothetical protein
MENTASQLLAPIKPETASGVVKITAVSHWAFAANDPILHRGCSVFSRRVAPERIDYNYFRYYDPKTGRYIQADPRGILLDFSEPSRQVAAQMGMAIPDLNHVDGLNHSYSYVNQNPLMYTDPTGESLLFGAGFGFVSDVALQLATNGGNFSCIDWKSVAIATAVGAVSPTLIATTRTAYRSAKAGQELQRQLHFTKAASRRQKLRNRIHDRNKEFTSAVGTQAAWQTATFTAQNASGGGNDDCGCQ